jgi:SAM-dependent methyltransferase
MQPNKPDWYKTVWSLEIKNQSWVEETQAQVDFLTRALGLTGRESVLDLACGFGRHALVLARRGHPVVGVDITPAYVADAAETARAEGLPATFHCMDIRDAAYANEFDVVLSMADGAIGYLESDAENAKIFDVAARALKAGGYHVMDICNAEHAMRHFPKKWWACGEHALSLAQFTWDAGTKRMLYGGWEVPYGQPAARPAITCGDPIRLYTPAEIESICAARGLRVRAAYAGFSDNPANENELQMVVVAQKHAG